MEESTIVGLAGLFVGLLTSLASLWWNYKTRASTHREQLYLKQIEAYSELVVSSNRFLEHVYAYLELLRKGGNAKTLNALKQKQRDAFLDFFHTFIRLHVFLPTEVLTRSLKLISRVRSYTVELGEAEQDIELKRKEMAHLQIDLVDAMREAAGIGPLSEEMRKVFGATV